MVMLNKIIKLIFLGLVRFYQLCISPLFPSSCRHQPTCSQYMIEAIHEWGPGKGVILGLKRLSKCHPLGTHGYDPVPQNKEK